MVFQKKFVMIGIKKQIKLMIKRAKEGKETWGNGKIIKEDSDKED